MLHVRCPMLRLLLLLLFESGHKLKGARTNLFYRRFGHLHSERPPGVSCNLSLPPLLLPPDLLPLETLSILPFLAAPR